MRLFAFVSASVLSLTALATPGTAQERLINFAVRGGVSVAPAYPGASNYEVGPDLGLSFGAFKWGAIDVGNGIGALPENGVRFRPAFRIIGSRDAADHVELTGLSDVDTAVELGLGLAVQQDRWLAFGEVRKGVTGHSGVTGTLGMDVIFRPDPRWTITAGPRVSFGDGEYAGTYFGVSAAEAAASGFGAFDASGGALGAGFEVEATYQINDAWAFNSALVYEKLMGDAADSPVTLSGSEDQWSIRFGLSRAFTLRF